MTPPVAASTASKSISLILRVLTVASLVISIIILITNKTSLQVTLTSDLSVLLKLRFNDIYAYRYMLAAIVIGFQLEIMLSLAKDTCCLISSRAESLLFSLQTAGVISVDGKAF